MATLGDATRRHFVAGTKSAPQSTATASKTDGAARQAGYARGSFDRSRATVGAALSPVVALALIGIFWASMAYGD